MWSSEVKKFFYDVENVYECLKLSKMSEHKGLYDDMTWQQFTGMVDEDGKEIYEGDIVKGSIDIDPSGTYQQRMLVSWSHPNGYNWTYYKLDTLKVIGNFYETPELLKNNDN